MPVEDLVDLLRWPAEADRRDEQRRPACLWLLPAGELPPVLGPGEDWIRVPADERDVHARLQRLAARAASPPPLAPGEVAVSDDGLVTRLGVRIWLPPIEAAILATLGAAPDTVVRREVLAVAAWGDPTRTGRRLDSRVFALRGRVRPLGIAIHTIRGRGYLLSAAADEDSGPRGRVHGDAQR